MPIQQRHTWACCNLFSVSLNSHQAVRRWSSPSTGSFFQKPVWVCLCISQSLFHSSHMRENIAFWCNSFFLSGSPHFRKGVLPIFTTVVYSYHCNTRKIQNSSWRTTRKFLVHFTAQKASTFLTNHLSVCSQDTTIRLSGHKGYSLWRHHRSKKRRCETT